MLAIADVQKTLPNDLMPMKSQILNTSTFKAYICRKIPINLRPLEIEAIEPRGSLNH